MQVTWSAAANTSSYAVLQSTDATTYTTIASVTGQSWTSGTLAKGKYTFEISYTIGANWTSVMSAASPQTQITGNGCK